MHVRKTKKAVFGAGAALAVAAVGIATALPAQAQFEEMPVNDAIKCDFDGDGTSTEYIAQGTVSMNWNERLLEPDVYAISIISVNRDVEFRSVDGESIYSSGVNVVQGTGYEAIGTFEGRALINVRFSDASGSTVASIFARGEISNFEFTDDATIRIKGPCGLPYEPTDE